MGGPYFPPKPDADGSAAPSPPAEDEKPPEPKSDKPADARDAHDRAKVIENQKRKGNLSEAEANRLIEGIGAELSPRAERSDSGELSAAKTHRLQRAKKVIPSGPGYTITTNEAGEETITGRILIVNFDVNSSDLKPDHMFGLDLVADMMNSSPEAKAYLEGRASQTGSEQWNERLSDSRANEVFFYLTGVRNVDPAKFVDIIGLGSADPLLDRAGTEEALNRSVRLVHQTPRALPELLPPATSSHADASDTWAIKLGLTVGISYLLSLGYATAVLKNMKTKEKRSGQIWGFGGGAGFSTPGANPFSDWVEFKTDGLYTFEAFEGTSAYVYSYGIGVVVGGYQSFKLQFPLLGNELIDLSGFSMGNFGYESSANLLSKWNFS